MQLSSFVLPCHFNLTSGSECLLGCVLLSSLTFLRFDGFQNLEQKPFQLFVFIIGLIVAQQHKSPSENVYDCNYSSKTMSNVLGLK